MTESKDAETNLHFSGLLAKACAEKGGSNDDMTVFRTREDMCRVQLYHSL